MLISQVNSGRYSPPASTEPTAPLAVATSSAPHSVSVELPAKAIRSAEAPAKNEQLADAVQQANKVIRTMTNDVEFTVDSDTGIHVIKVVNTQTQEVIRQFPSEEMIDLAKILDKLHGLIIRQKA